MHDSWDLDFDVVVAGYGFAGGWAAIAAHDLGARVAIFEKMRHFGGTSILSGGACAYGTDYDATLTHLRASCGITTDDGVLQAYAQGMCELREVMTQFGAEVGIRTIAVPWGGTYPLPGGQTLGVIRYTRSGPFKEFDWTTGTTAGAIQMWVLNEHIEARGISQHYEAPIERLVMDGDGAVTGVVVEQGGRRLAVRARRGVILCTGGFEHNQRLISHYLQIQQATGVSPLGNTGDGILMAQKAGAALWHMWHVHGSYGFRIPGIPVGIRAQHGGYRDGMSPAVETDPERSAELQTTFQKAMPYIAVNRFGRRFMNEMPRAIGDTPIRSLEVYDFDLLDYPNIPCYLIFDNEGRSHGPIGAPKFNDESLQFRWSGDNMDEVRAGYIIERGSVQEIAAHWGIDPAALAETVERWNNACASGVDRDYGRSPATMMPVRKPPFYAIDAWPIISNTQGGPVHDEFQRVLDPYQEPIPRLYEAGDLGSIFGHVYLLCGNLIECLVGGRVAGENCAKEPPWC